MVPPVLAAQQRHLQDAIWDHLSAHETWPSTKDVTKALDALDIDLEGIDQRAAGVFEINANGDKTLRFGVEALVHPMLRQLFEPMPTLIELGIQRLIANPPYTGERRAELAFDEVKGLWASEKDVRLVAILLQHIGRFPITYGGGTPGAPCFVPNLEVLRYERVKTLDDVLAMPSWVPRIEGAEDLTGPAWAWAVRVFEEACQACRWPVPVDFAIRNRALGYTREIAERDLSKKWVSGGFGWSRADRIVLRLPVLERLDPTGEIRKLFGRAAGALGRMWMTATPPAGQQFVTITFEQLRDELGVSDKDLIPVVLFLEGEHWVSASWWGKPGEARTINISDATKPFRKVSTWDAFLEVRRSLYPTDADYPRPYDPRQFDQFVSQLVESLPDPMKVFRDRLAALEAMTNHQQRGRDFEALLKDLFNHFGLVATGAFVGPTDQVDGAFELDHVTYLAEAKWVQDPIGVPDLAIFEKKVRSRSASTRGVLISMSGFAARTAVKSMITGGTAAFLLMDREHLDLVLGRKLGLDDLLRQMRRHLEQHGDPYLGADQVVDEAPSDETSARAGAAAGLLPGSDLMAVVTGIASPLGLIAQPHPGPAGPSGLARTTGLSPAAVTVAELVARRWAEKPNGLVFLRGGDIASATELTPQAINDAVEELGGDRLVEVQALLGTAPFNFGWVRPKHWLFHRLRGSGAISFDPEEDVRAVMAAVGATEQLDGAALDAATQLGASRLNLAVDYIEGQDLAQVLRATNTAPYSFMVLIATGKSRRFAAENPK